MTFIDCDFSQSLSSQRHNSAPGDEQEYIYIYIEKLGKERLCKGSAARCRAQWMWLSIVTLHCPAAGTPPELQQRVFPSCMWFLHHHEVVGRLLVGGDVLLVWSGWCHCHLPAPAWQHRGFVGLCILFAPTPGWSVRLPVTYR